MPQAVTHFLVALLLISFIRDFYIRKKGHAFPLIYVFLAGIGGVLPDIDFAVFWTMKFLGSPVVVETIHRTYTHAIFFPLAFLILALILPRKPFRFGRHLLNLRIVAMMLSFGSLTHIVLDALLAGTVMPLYPFSTMEIGSGFIEHFSDRLQSLFLATLDGVLFIAWVIYLEARHRISDFI